MTKFLIIGDLHGKKPKLSFKDFDAIIVPGDICSDSWLRPLTKKWLKSIKGGKKFNFEDFIEKNIGKREYNKLNKESLKGGRAILKYLNSFGKPVFLVPGNWDQSYGPTRIKDRGGSPYQYRKSALDYMLGNTNKFLTKGLKDIKDCQFRLHKFNGINIIGYGLSSFPESKMARKLKNKSEAKRLKDTNKKIMNKLSKPYSKKSKKNPTIFITHNVPYNTKIDIIRQKGSPLYGKHHGSTIAREFCAKYSPLVCVGGHIHEHFKKDKIKKTTLINSGFGPKVNVLLEIKENKIKKLKFIKK